MNDPDPTFSPQILEFVKALARDRAKRDIRLQREDTRRRISEESQPSPSATVAIPPRRRATKFDAGDLTRALDASLKAGLTPHRVELLTDGRILLHFPVT